MAKSMARIENGVVINVEWCSSAEPQTETLVDIADRQIGIGDAYDGEHFYREGERVLTLLEAAEADKERMQQENEALAADNADMAEALALLGYEEAKANG